MALTGPRLKTTPSGAAKRRNASFIPCSIEYVAKACSASTTGASEAGKFLSPVGSGGSCADALATNRDARRRANATKVVRAALSFFFFILSLPPNRSSAWTIGRSVRALRTAPPACEDAGRGLHRPRRFRAAARPPRPAARSPPLRQSAAPFGLWQKPLRAAARGRASRSTPARSAVEPRASDRGRR